MSEYKVYWGDLHTHHNHDHEQMPPPDELAAAAEKLILSGRENIDFFAVLLYPFKRYVRNGLAIESVYNTPDFLAAWRQLGKLVKKHHEPGKCVLFAGYEWHGDRTKYGDHNVIYRTNDGELLDCHALVELYDSLRFGDALAIPHHTAYYNQGGRGKDWDIFDETLSPVMEVFSRHGCSEGAQSGGGLVRNQSMGPDVAGGSYQDALARGLKVGVIGSNDGFGLPGRWGAGRAAVLARELTRDAIFEALSARRCYAVTGDRILLDVRINDQPMGSTVQAGSEIDVDVDVTCSDALDRIELIHNNVAADTYCHSGKWEAAAYEEGRFKVRIEAGWGPGAHYGFDVDDQQWDLRLELDGGQILGVEKCWSYPGGRIVAQDDTTCLWRLVTHRRWSNYVDQAVQGMVFEIAGSQEAKLTVTEKDFTVTATVGQLLAGAQLASLTEECKRRIAERFGLVPEELDNHDLYHHNARKIKLHRAVPQTAYRVSHCFKNVKLADGVNFFYVRVSQANGQKAWSSPVWVESG